MSLSQISVGNSEPNKHAQLDVVDSKKGVLIPRIALQNQTSPQPISSNAVDLPISLLVFNTNTTTDLDKAYYYWSGIQWTKVVVKEDLDALPKTPWNKAGTINRAELNTYDIYQTGKVGIGTINMVPGALLDVRGDVLINNLTIGKGSGTDNDTNTGIGYGTLKNNTTGTGNTATGYLALTNTTAGKYNTANGYQALAVNSLGNNNTSIGFQALNGNTSGSNNVATGHQALLINKTGSNNTAIGDSAGPTTDNLSNTTAIGYNAKVTQSNTIQLGNEAIENVYTSGGLGLGTTAPKAKLHVVGDVIIEKTEPLVNAKALVIDASGKIGVEPVIPPTETAAKVMFAQSKVQTDYTTTADINLINSGNPFVVAWLADEIIVNNIVDFTTLDNSFTIKNDGVYEVSGFMNYNPNATTPAAYTTNREQAAVGVNVTIQILKTGTSTWTDLASVRYLFAGPNVQGTAASIVIPPAIMTLKKADKIRMIFKRPTSSFGLPHGTYGNPGISLPGGILFSKGIKILEL